MQHEKNGFTFEDLKEWQATAELQRPEVPSMAACLMAPTVQSFAAVASRRGMILTLTIDGHDVTLNFNAVLCEALIRAIAKAGYQVEWLARDGRAQHTL